MNTIEPQTFVVTLHGNWQTLHILKSSLRLSSKTTNLRDLQWNIRSFAVPVEKHEQFQEQFQNILDRVLKTEYQNNHCNTNIVTLHNVGWEAFILIFKASYELLHVSSGGSSLTREAGLTNVACIIRNQICEEYTIKTSIHFCY